MAAKGIAHADLIAAFESRWDHFSARVMAAEALAAAGVDKKAEYAQADVAAVSAALDKIGGAAAVIAALGAPPAAAPAAKPAAKAEAKPAAKPAEKPAAKPAEKPAAKPAEKPAAKPAAKAAAKPAAKAAAKGGKKPAAKS